MKLEDMLMFTLLINVLLFVAQFAITEVGVENGFDVPEFFNYSQSFISEFDDGEYVLDQDVAEKLPEAEQNRGIIETITGILTDIFDTIKSWILSIPGSQYLIGIVYAVPNFIKGIGFPVEIAFALGVVWHAFAVWLFVAWLKG